MLNKPTYKFFGESAILIEWDKVISKEVIADINLYQQKIKAQNFLDIEDFVIAYNSLTIIYKKSVNKLDVQNLKEIYNSKISIKKASNFLWEIPVCYDVKFGIDLEELSSELGISTEAIIKKHSSKVYTVYFIGFLPGFLYLGGLDKSLHFPRKAVPRIRVPERSVAIGGNQTGIYPQESSGGWNIIGKTPISFFNISNSKPCFAKSGDQIKFKSVSYNEYLSIKNKIDTNDFNLIKTKLND